MKYKNKYSFISLIFGILSLFSIVMAEIGMIFATIGIIFYFIQKRIKQNRTTLIALVLNILGLMINGYIIARFIL